jgi:hypothetical protein
LTSALANLISSMHGHIVPETVVLPRLVHLAVTNAFAALRLLPTSDPTSTDFNAGA